MKRNFTHLLLIICLLFGIQASAYAGFRVPGLIPDPNWMVDEEIAEEAPGWNQGYIKCRRPYGGENLITENQKILNSWGYKAKSFEEIKDLMPEPHYNMYMQPEVWGTFRINETAWDPVKPIGPMWDKFMAQTKKNKKECYLDEKNWLRGYKYGIPFPDLAENDPKIGVKLVWNYFKRYQDNDREVDMLISVINRKGHIRQNLLLNRRLLMNARVRDDNVTVDGLYKPNPKNLEFIYATPYISPYNLRGTLPLYFRYDDPDKTDDMWIYIPSIRRVRRMSTNQHQDRLPGGVEWTWDNTEGFEGNVTRFDFVYLGRKLMLSPTVSHTHSYYNKAGHINSNDHYYQKRNLYVVKCVYKNPINMTSIVLYLDPLLYAAGYSVDQDMKGRDWIIQLVTQGRCKRWFYSMYNDFAIDILTKHSTRACFSYSGSGIFRANQMTMDSLKKEFLSR